MTKRKIKNRSRHKPSSRPPSIGITTRDKKVLRALYRFRVMTTPQIRALFFQGIDPSVCWRRLNKLFHNKYIARLRVPFYMGEGTKPDVNALNDKGADVLAAELKVNKTDLDWRKRDNNISAAVLDHTLDINEVRVAVELAVSDTPLEIAEWLDERALKRFRKKNKVKFEKIPDAYFSIHNTAKKTRACFFLEVDRGTEAGASKIAAKLDAYQHYYATGQYERDFGVKSLRVLFVIDTRVRLENILMNVAPKRKRGKLFYFATIEDVTTTNALTDQIWLEKQKSPPVALLVNSFNWYGNNGKQLRS